MEGSLLFRIDRVRMPHLDQQQDPLGAPAPHDQIRHKTAASDREGLLGLHCDCGAQAHKTGKSSLGNPGMEQPHQSFTRLQLHCQAMDCKLVWRTPRITPPAILLRAARAVPLA